MKSETNGLTKENVNPILPRNLISAVLHDEKSLPSKEFMNVLCSFLERQENRHKAKDIASNDLREIRMKASDERRHFDPEEEKSEKESFSYCLFNVK